MKRLWVQLTLAFSLVVLITVGTIAVLADLTAGTAFRRYLSFSDSFPRQNQLDVLARHYRSNGGWHGVGAILDRGPRSPAARPRDRQDRERFLDRLNPRAHIILADAEDRVVFDSRDGQLDRRLTLEERAAAQDIVVDDQVAGRLVIALPVPRNALGPLEEAFVDQLRRLLFVAGLLACGLGVLLGLAFSKSLTAPLQRLVGASHAVAARDFSSRVTVGGSLEMVEVATAFNEMAAALERSERDRRNLVADVAHELRAPLAVMQGNLQAILDGVYDLDIGEVSRVYDETRLLSRLVDDLRELALADAGQLRLTLLPTDLRQVVLDTSDSLSLACEAFDVDLIIRIPDGLPPVLVDGDRMAQILRNLVLNALRHAQPGDSIAIKAADKGDLAVVTIIDTGEGIAPHDLPHVFERFWRADRARTRAANGMTGGGWDRATAGTGLGLPIAQSLVEAQGGRIWVESVLGEGAAFHFTIPLETRTAAVHVSARDAG
jgi:two-component system OmpR family sensor kinase/two-component system sensor histidine kinase BaeS